MKNITQDVIDELQKESVSTYLLLDLEFADNTLYYTNSDFRLLNVIENESFKILTYTGDGTTPRTITGLGFQPDLVWIKGRDSTEWHYLLDSVRGVGNRLSSNDTAIEVYSAESLISFDEDGFTVGSAAPVNEDTTEFVAWCWKADETGVTDATQEEKYSTESGLSIIKYEGDGIAGRILEHSLGAIPTRIYVKRLDGTSDWTVYDSILGNTNFLRLNTDAQASTSSGAWNDTSPTSTTATLGNSSTVNFNGADYIAYIFTDIENVSETGTYTGNGSATGPIVSTSIEAQYVMIKREDGTGNWRMADVVRGSNNSLMADVTDSETTYPISLGKNNFQPLTADSDINDSGGEYIYQAFAASEDLYYQPISMEVANIQQTQGFSIDKVSVEMSNIDLTFSSILQSQDTLNRTCVLTQIYLSPDTYTEIGRVEWFRGPLLEWGDLTQDSVRLTIGNEFSFWNKKTLRMPSPQCPWFFKADRCGYTGIETVCDRSATRCRELNNFDRFGGREFISDTEDQTVEWGAV